MKVFLKKVSENAFLKALVCALVMSGFTAVGSRASDQNSDFEVRISAPKGGLIVNQARAPGMGYFGTTPYYDLMLHSIFFINRGEETLTLKSGIIEVFANGRLLQSTPLSMAALANSQNMIVATSELANFTDIMFFTSQGLPDGITLSPTPEFTSSTATAIDDRYLLIAELPDKIKVTAVAIDRNGVERRAVGSVRVRDYKSENSYILPVEEGEWFISASPGILSHHRWTGMTEFALDIIKIDDRGSWSSGKADNWRTGVVPRWEDFYGYDKKVLAVADGEVVKIAEDNEFPLSEWARQEGESFPDYSARKNRKQMELYATPGLDFAKTVMGNHIVIAHANGEYSHYAHLAYGKIKVRLGQKVKQGDHIAGVGGTGEMPVVHLHFQIMDGIALLGSASLPVEFSNIHVNELGVAHHEPKAVHQGGFFVNNRTSKLD